MLSIAFERTFLILLRYLIFSKVSFGQTLQWKQIFLFLPWKPRGKERSFRILTCFSRNDFSHCACFNKKSLYFKVVLHELLSDLCSLFFLFNSKVTEECSILYLSGICFIHAINQSSTLSFFLLTMRGFDVVQGFNATYMNFCFMSTPKLPSCKLVYYEEFVKRLKLWLAVQQLAMLLCIIEDS